MSTAVKITIAIRERRATSLGWKLTAYLPEGRRLACRVERQKTLRRVGSGLLRLGGLWSDGGLVNQITGGP